MITSEQLLTSILNEIRVSRHVATKLPAGTEDFRPTEGQRTNLEVLRYLAVCANGTLDSLLAGNWEQWNSMSNAMESAIKSFEDFDAVMEAQAARFEDKFKTIGSEEFESLIVSAPSTGKVPLGMALMRTAYAWAVAYRHELFLRAKLCGVTDIGTRQNWGGQDAKPA